MAELIKGLKGKKEMEVNPADLASHSGNIGADVLSTSRIILLMEQAARDAIEGCLPPGKITVGTSISMKHFAATPMGMKVRAEAELKEIDGRRLLFEINVFDELEKVSKGTNERYIISLEGFKEKLEKKISPEQSD